MISLEDLNVVFGEGTPSRNHALRSLSLEIEQGDFISIIGSNGAGKSTLFNAVAGHTGLTSGRICFKKRDVSREPEHKRAFWVGRIFQDPLKGSAGNMTLLDNMLITARKGFKGLTIRSGRRHRDQIREQLAILGMGLEDRLSDNVGLLSGGQRQALTLLMTVLSQPELLLLDEHTAALDPRNAEIVLAHTQRFIRERRITTMMITHNMQQAIDMGNRLLMMDRGEIILHVAGEEKRNLTVPGLVERFRRLRHRDFGSDEALLS